MHLFICLLIYYWCLCMYCIAAHLQRAALGRVEDQEAAQDSLAVCRHVEGHAIFPPQNTLPQLLKDNTHSYAMSFNQRDTVSSQLGTNVYCHFTEVTYDVIL